MSLPPPDLPCLARRARDSSKRDYGRVLIVGGADGMAGAPALAAMAALRGGAGLVDLAAPAPVAAIAATFDPCFMAHPLPGAADGSFAAEALDSISALADRADVLAVGPGIGRGDAVGRIVERLWRSFPGPAVFDADALWWLARAAPGALAVHAGPRVLTPHAGEMRRFLGAAAAAAEPPRDLLETAAERLAGESGCVILLKGPDTLVTDGGRRARNATGNPGMASGGMGDVLTGLVAALLRQPAAPSTIPPRLLDPFDAARLGAWVHGRAGDLAAEAIGEISLTARDVVAFIPAALAAVVAA